MIPNFEEILKKRGITPKTKHHTYEYMYESMLECMKKVHNAAIEEAAENGTTMLTSTCIKFDKESILKLKIK